MNLPRGKKIPGQPSSGAPIESPGNNSSSRLRLRRTRTGRIITAAVTIVLAALAGYAALILASPTDVHVGPLKFEFALRPALAANLKRDDLALLKFAFRWLKFAFFQEPTLTVKPAAMGKAKRRR